VNYMYREGCGFNLRLWRNATLPMGREMKSFESFRLDTENHCLWRENDRVRIPPRAYDILRYLVEHSERLVTSDELLEKLWPDTYVNPELVRKYILEIRKILGEQRHKIKFIETLPKRGYRFVAVVRNEEPMEPLDLSALQNASGQNIDAQGANPGEVSGPGERRMWTFMATSLMALIVGAAMFGYFGLARTAANAGSGNSSSIAVLPFADLSPAKDQEYFSDGLSDQLIHDLTKVPSLKVVGRSSAFQFKGKNEDLRSIGRKLGVANVLEGSVRRDGNRLRITAELIKTDDGFQLWSQTYDRQVGDIFAVQDEIARAATASLQPKLLTGQGRSGASTSKSASPESYEAYLQANYFLGKGLGKQDVDRTLAYADTAIKLDDKFAPAWALRASVENMMATYNLTEGTEGFRRARGDAERAIALDPSSASGYLALARTQIDYDWNWETADECLTKASALEPGSVDILRIRSALSMALGNSAKAIEFASQAVSLDPLRANSHLGLGQFLYTAGRYDEAHASVQRALDLNPQASFAHSILAKILLAEGKPQQALAEIENEPSDWQASTVQALSYHALGREQESNAALGQLVAKHNLDSAYQIAEAYAFRGEDDKSFEWLDRAYKQRDPGLSDVKVDPLLRNLHHDPRYAELLKRMHLPTTT
jgi:TolB-like protein/DNA-binding winged helix-turn-helix (wHTH) protein/Flp pilus assembly protein TadD